MTIDSPPWPYEIVGLVHSSAGDRGLTSTHGGAIPKVLSELEKQADRMGAEAIIGLRIEATYTKGDAIWIAAIGTAVKWLRSEDQKMSE